MKLFVSNAGAHLCASTDMYRIFLLTIALMVIIPVSIQNVLAQSSPSVTSPVLKDQQGNVLSRGSDGQILVLSTSALNNSDDPLQFVAIIESRDKDGVTQFLGFSIGRLEANAQSEIGISWTPQNAGNYQLRAFLLSGFPNPQILTTVETSDIVIE